MDVRTFHITRRGVLWADTLTLGGPDMGLVVLQKLPALDSHQVNVQGY
jgi:hypothetical protein